MTVTYRCSGRFAYVGEAVAHWSPDGKQVLFLAHPDTVTPAANWYLVDTGGGAVRELIHSPDYAGDAQWSPDGSRILYTGAAAGLSCGVYLVDPGTGFMTSLGVQVGKYCPFAAIWSPDGSRITYRISPINSGEVTTVSSAGAVLSQITFADASPAAVEWSPDGRRLKVWHVRDVGRNAYAWLASMNPDGSSRTQLTPTDGWYTGGGYSPDGHSIIHHRFYPDEGRSHIRVIDDDGGNPLEVPVRDGAPGGATWRP